MSLDKLIYQSKSVFLSLKLGKIISVIRQWGLIFLMHIKHLPYVRYSIRDSLHPLLEYTQRQRTWYYKTVHSIEHPWVGLRPSSLQIMSALSCFTSGFCRASDSCDLVQSQNLSRPQYSYLKMEGFHIRHFNLFPSI